MKLTVNDMSVLVIVKYEVSVMEKEKCLPIKEFTKKKLNKNKVTKLHN